MSCNFNVPNFDGCFNNERTKTGDPTIDNYTVGINIPKNGDIEIELEIPNKLHFDNQTAPKGVQYQVNGFLKERPGYYSVTVYVNKQADIWSQLQKS